MLNTSPATRYEPSSSPVRAEARAPSQQQQHLGVGIDTDGEDFGEAGPLQPRAGGAWSQSGPRRQSISLNAVINHRRALLGAFLTRVGSNISLPACVPPEPDSPLTQPSYPEPSNAAAQQKPIVLRLSPVNTTPAHLSSLDAKDKEVARADEAVGERQRLGQRRQHSELLSSVSTLYANLLVVIGVAVPVTSSVSQQVPPALHQAFYLYLYVASVGFVVALCATVARDRALKKMIVKHVGLRETSYVTTTRHCCPADQQYGSFCLRLGTVGFGAGSLVFAGLQIGAELAAEPLRSIVPGARLLLVTAQMHFIFLNSSDLVFSQHQALAKLGLMHLIATNICEWLKALVEETRCEIVELDQESEIGGPPSEIGIHRQLLRDASPFLFPCTIEFSLICAVVLYEMWRRIQADDDHLGHEFCGKSGPRSRHQLSIDCASAHRGLFGGILVVAATVLSLIMFFVLKEAKPTMAVQQVTSLEIAIQMSGTLAAVVGGFKLLGQLERVGSARPPHLDATLLAAAQAGVYLHSTFGAVGSILTRGPDWVITLAADFLALLQSTLQTILIEIAWRRRSRTSTVKPGRELITFLIVVNIAMWTVNTLEKSRAGVRPDHLELFGVWAWTIITHVSMPLAIFYRFHSAICLFEVWKSCYKYRPAAGYHVPPQPGFDY